MSDNKVETELLSQIKEVLLKFPKYWEKDVLLRNKVAEDLRNYNQELIEALLSNQLVKDTYSISLNSTNIFKIDEFISMLRYKNYWENSYTKYSNEIGLTSEGKYLNYNTDVVLDFPHKDSVLEGGMTKEDQGKKEIYYHNVLAKEEIDTLLSPKVLANIKKYDKSGEHDIDDFTDKDNLIIKGNNLVALHSLKERYENKIKMVYIDPPYNTGSDSFKYNDKFSRSTWLTFIKNRLEEAWNLLCNDGVLAVQCSFHNFAYLKVMMDSIFGEDRKVLTFNILVRHPERTLTSDKNFNDVVEYVLVY
ncbi:MAG: site-specific DNA-methyltransferase, partial [Tetragenococcus koreensis]|nr:site-specific DNA-methyltransferase [Tetragenococcus koreensis]